jgi:hypothetical protein
MIDKLRFAIDNTENPKLLSILAKIAELEESSQEAVLNAVETGTLNQVLSLLGEKK